MPNANCSLTVQNILNFCSTHSDLLPLSNVGGFSQEPGLSLANDCISDLISDPNDWSFNRCELPPLFTCASKQDYLYAGACAFTLSVSGTTTTQTTQSQGWAIGLSSSGAINNVSSVVTVTTLENHRFQVGDVIYLTGVVMTSGTSSVYNSQFVDNGSNSQWTGGWVITAVAPQSFTFMGTEGMTSGDTGGAPGITNWGYGTSASMQEVNNNSSPPNQWPLTIKRELVVSSRLAMPEKVCVLADYGNGILKIRLLWVPSTVIYAVNIVYQARAPLFTALTQTWAPFPDSYGAVIRQAMLARMYRYLNDPKADTEYKKLQAVIAKIQATDDATLTDVSLVPESGLMDAGGWDWGW